VIHPFHQYRLLWCREQGKHAIVAHTKLEIFGPDQFGEEVVRVRRRTLESGDYPPGNLFVEMMKISSGGVGPDD